MLLSNESEQAHKQRIGIIELALQVCEKGLIEEESGYCVGIATGLGKGKRRFGVFLSANVIALDARKFCEDCQGE